MTLFLKLYYGIRLITPAPSDVIASFILVALKSFENSCSINSSAIKPTKKIDALN